jgi:hypothetical protein
MSAALRGYAGYHHGQERMGCMRDITKAFRVHAKWVERHLPALMAILNTYGKYRRTFALFAGLNGSENTDGTWTITVHFRVPCRPRIRFVTRRGGVDTHQRSDLRKVLKMLTVAHNKAASAA